MIGNQIFISGGTGYLGVALTSHLLNQGWSVTVLTRKGSQRKVPSGVNTVLGNALDAADVARAASGCATLVHLTGVAHPAPWKERAFRAVDLTSLRASVGASAQAGVRHIVYVSVAHPAPVMRAYIRVRQECEAILTESGIPHTILRPWYILGPGHRWPVLLKPMYALLEAFPATKPGAQRLGLVTLEQMTRALGWLIERPADGVRIIGVPEIRRLGA